MFENKKTYDKNDVIVLVLKLLLAVAAVAAAIVAGIKIYEKIQAKRLMSLCDCCDDEWDDDLCLCDDECECCCEETADEAADVIEEVTKKEINPTEEN